MRQFIPRLGSFAQPRRPVSGGGGWEKTSIPGSIMVEPIAAIAVGRSERNDKRSR
jgi:hypothetical protein